MINRVIAFSDLHLAPEGQLNNFHAGPALAACLRATCRPETLLVLHGDVFDFLQVNGRPHHLKLDGIPGLIKDVLDGIAASSWGQEVLRAVGEHVSSGGRCLILPGNHDPELAHPAAEPLLREALGLAGDEARLSIHVSSEPWALTVGRWQVVIGHGHRGDEWNNVDEALLRHAARQGGGSLALPPGSLLVLETLNALKREGYAFVDLLKPETPHVLALMFWVAPRLTAAHLPGAMDNFIDAFTRKVVHRMGEGKFLSADAAKPPREWMDVLVEQLVSVLTEQEREGDPHLVRMQLRSWFQEHGPAKPGMLSGSGGGGGLWFGRLFRWKTHRFFDMGHLAEEDLRIVKSLLPEGSGPRVVICGHTHAARACVLPGERIYLNTGTWTDLMRFPSSEEEEELWAWRARLLRNEVPRLRRLTYAEVTPEGGALRWWQPDPTA